MASSFAIAFSLALLIFLNFYNHYIAFYEQVQSGGQTYWQATSFLTSDFSAWLPVVNTALILTMIGHAVLIAVDKFLLRRSVELVLDVFGLAAIISLAAIFPFNFNVIPDPAVADGVALGVRITLVLMAVGFGIGILVKAIQLIVNVVEGKY